ncbi:putative ankyrin repeat protein [Cotonvirus japonicus]|uniref:Ankyrin repeat protein n=1 Tax=Cotonvirus japonicus TaxID=2811091 RepID=A0ABM7NTP0_9VIRU|nr:putative ankyrin repeat protein [Cotonvirus japonicus]BCS83543.1 putative ankyrin repeat protein [Cotonvirus japonicus]
MSVVSDFNLESTKIYQYYVNNPNIFDGKLDIIIKELLRYSNISKNDLFVCYDKIIRAEMLQILYDIVDNSNYYENVMIFVVSVRHKNIELIQYMLNIGYNINNTYVNKYKLSTDDSMFNHFLSKNLEFDGSEFRNVLFDFSLYHKDDLEFIKFGVENGADISFNNYIIVLLMAYYKYIDILEYFLTMDIPKNTLLHVYKIYILFMRNNKINHHDNILNIPKNNNISVNDIFVSDNDLYLLSRCNVDVIEYLITQEFIIPEILLKKACQNENLDLVRFLLEKGQRPDIDTLKRNFEYMCYDIIKLFVEFNIDLSNVPIINDFDKFMSGINKCGMNTNNFCNYMLYDLLYNND